MDERERIDILKKIGAEFKLCRHCKESIYFSLTLENQTGQWVHVNTHSATCYVCPVCGYRSSYAGCVVHGALMGAHAYTGINSAKP